MPVLFCYLAITVIDDLPKGLTKEGNVATPSVSVGELRNAISTVVKMLANRGIKVTQTGLQAYVKYDEKTLEPVRVNIPSISDTSPPELVTAIKGFVDHE